MKKSDTKKTAAKAKRPPRRGPSAASLREIPEVPREKEIYHGRGIEGLRKAREWARAQRGRPKKGETPEGSTVKSVRLPDPTWAALEAEAKKRGVTLHALLKDAIAKVLGGKAA